MKALDAAVDSYVTKLLAAVSEAVEHDRLDALEPQLAVLKRDLEEALEPEPAELVLKVLNEEKRLVTGWASVVTEYGRPVEDRQGDIISMDELRKAVHEFMESRKGGEMHKRLGVGTVVDSFVLGKAEQDALGIDLGREGWLVTMHVTDDSTWEKVKKGELKSFSLGGSGVREKIGKVDGRRALLLEQMRRRRGEA